MSPDEFFVLIVCAIIVVIGWSFFAVKVAVFKREGLSGKNIWPVVLSQVVSGLLLFLILKTMASHDVREDARYLIFYTLMGMAWLVVAVPLALAGISSRDDLLERGNRSASYAIAGFIVGTSLCFAGGNIGNGPGWWVVVFCALMATGALAICWWLANLFAPISDHITIDRDPAIGLRVGGYFIGTGLILGRAVAGDWQSLPGTVSDFAQRSWPALLLLIVVIATERRARPRFDIHTQNLVFRGVVPALLYLILGVAGAALHGAIE